MQQYEKRPNFIFTYYSPKKEKKNQYHQQFKCI
jgi:hypothetical protein